MMYHFQPVNSILNNPPISAQHWAFLFKQFLLGLTWQLCSDGCVPAILAYPVLGKSAMYDVWMICLFKMVIFHINRHFPMIFPWFSYSKWWFSPHVWHGGFFSVRGPKVIMVVSDPQAPALADPPSEKSVWNQGCQQNFHMKLHHLSIS